ncbi:RHTO0S29e01024g1_1 [Rhodotorula toruloides]|uniref:RHTO0S29e01024g1_1 n=1 Tax=Rhodotorula toruloides TaxID=5286 RepID=A0A061BJV2_RHOTO|nr:RHTO0S29e01024g1_1 [Rhodotorula toruloides]
MLSSASFATLASRDECPVGSRSTRSATFSSLDWRTVVLQGRRLGVKADWRRRVAVSATFAHADLTAAPLSARDPLNFVSFTSSSSSPPSSSLPSARSVLQLARMAAPAPPAPAPAAAPAPAPPCVPKVVQHQVNEGLSFSLTCDLELDITATTFEEVTLPLKGVALIGDWTCRVDRQEEGGKSEKAVHIQHGDLDVGAFGKDVDVMMKVLAVTPDDRWLLSSAHWRHCPAPNASEDDPFVAYTGYQLDIRQDDIDDLRSMTDGDFDPASHRRYRVHFQLAQRKTTPTPEAKELMYRMRDLDLSPTPYDVRFFFPNACDGGAELWSETGFLSGASYYFDCLLSSGFCETVTHSKKRPRTRKSAPAATSQTPADADAKDFDDSDDETDELYFERRSSVLHEHEGDCPLEYKQVTITKTAFSTYRAVLGFMRTGYIVFAPLTSACKPSNPSASRTRREHLLNLRRKTPTSAVSPKSVFRLAHLIELDDLPDLCLADLRRQLTVEIAPVELVDDASICFDAWREVIIDFIFENCEAVEESQGWKDLQGKIRRDEVPGAAPIMLELMSRFTPKKAKGASFVHICLCLNAR